MHDYRFLKKLAPDYEVTLLLYETNNPLSEEIRSIPGLNIIVRKTLKKSLPLTDLFYFKRLVKKLRPDIIHSGYLWQAGAVAAYSGFHPHLSMAWGSDVLVEPGKNPLIKKLVRKVVTTADHIQCDAEYVKTKIISDYGVASDKFTVFPWGIDLKMFSVLDRASCCRGLGIPADKFVVLFSRPLEPIYDLNTLLDGFHSFCEDKEDVIMLIAHEGSLLPVVKKYAEQYGLDNKIRLTGWIPNDKIPRLFNAADVFISTSLSDGTSLSLLEAMACGKGLVLTKLPSIMEWVGDENGLLINTESPDEVCSALNKYYHNRSLISLHGKKNIEIAKERADWDKNYLMLKEIYTKLTG